MFGDYEQSYLDSYRVINDQFMLDNNVGIVKAKTVALKHKSKTDLNDYRKIRTFLTHGYLEEWNVGTKKAQNCGEL